MNVDESITFLVLSWECHEVPIYLERNNISAAVCIRRERGKHPNNCCFLPPDKKRKKMPYHINPNKKNNLSSNAAVAGPVPTSDSRDTPSPSVTFGALVLLLLERTLCYVSSPSTMPLLRSSHTVPRKKTLDAAFLIAKHQKVNLLLNDLSCQRVDNTNVAFRTRTNLPYHQVACQHFRQHLNSRPRQPFAPKLSKIHAAATNRNTAQHRGSGK